MKQTIWIYSVLDFHWSGGGVTIAFREGWPGFSIAGPSSSLSPSSSSSSRSFDPELLFWNMTLGNEFSSFACGVEAISSRSMLKMALVVNSSVGTEVLFDSEPVSEPDEDVVLDAVSVSSSQVVK